jgi:hypothetical protein
MTNKPFRAVGERFELAGLIYEVEETDIVCRGCSFLYEEECECVMTDREREVAGMCASVFRPDDTFVIFKYIGEVP